MKAEADRFRMGRWRTELRRLLTGSPGRTAEAECAGGGKDFLRWERHEIAGRGTRVELIEGPKGT